MATLAHFAYFNKVVHEIAQFLSIYRKDPAEPILPSSYHTFVSEDGSEQALVYYYQKPAHFQVIMFSTLSKDTRFDRTFWMPQSHYTRRMRHDNALKQLPKEVQNRLESRQKKRVAKAA